MKKHLLTIVLATMFFTVAQAQVAIKPAGSGTTADPSAMLDVQSTNKGALLPRMTATQRLAIANPATGLMVYDTDSSTFMLKNASGWVKLQSTNDVVWKKNGNNIYRGDSSNIGIGTNNPSSKLHISDSYSFSSYPKPGAIIDYRVGYFGNTTDSTPIALKINASRSFEGTYSHLTGIDVNLKDSGYIAERYKLTGIKINSPGTGLDVTGNVGISANSKGYAAIYAENTSQTIFQNPPAAIFAKGTGVANGIVTSSVNGNALETGAGGVAIGTNSTFPTFKVSVLADSALPNAMIIRSYANSPALLTQGRVGINTLTPYIDAVLDVNGDMYIRGGNPGNGKVLTSNSDGKTSWQTPSGGTLYTAGSGINISGSNVISSTTPNYTAGDGINISGNTISATGASGWLKNGTAISLQNTTDYVGIGTPGNAGAKLRVVSNNEAGISVISGGTSTNAIFATAAGTDAVVANLLAGAGSKALIASSTTANAAEFFSQNAAAINVNPTTSTSKIAIVVPFDNSGFGTSTPTAKVHIVGANGLKYQDGNTQLSGKVLTSDANGNASWQSGNSQWTTNGANVYNNNAGNVGIGLTNPQAKLDVDGVIKIGSLVGSFNPANGMIAFDGTDFKGFNNGWKSFATPYTAGSGININNNVVSTIPQTLSIVGDSLALSGGGGKIGLPSSGSGGSSQFTSVGNNIYNNNSGKVLIGNTTVNGTAKFQVEDATNFGTTAQILSRNPYSIGMYVADSATSGNPVGCNGCGGNVALQAYSNFGTAILAKSNNGIGAYIRGGNSSEPAVKIENPGGSSLLGLQVHGGVDITGFFRLNDGNQQAGRVLTTDASGYASWQVPTGGGTTYSAGTGINISGGTISTNLAGGSGISVSGNTISSTLQAGSGISISGNTITATGVTGAGGWLKNGTDVSLQNTTDYVGIGTAGNAGAKLRVVSNNEAGISVISGGASTNAIFASSAGTDAITANILAGAGAKGLVVSSTTANAAQFFSQNSASINVNPTSSSSKIAIVVPFDNSGFGTTTPTERVHIVGSSSLKYQDGNEAVGKVLTSDANGRASWQAPANGGATAWSVDAGNNVYNSSTSNSTVGIGLSTGINTAYQLHTRSTKSGGAIALFQSNQSNANISLANLTGVAGSVFTNGTDFGLNSNTLSGTPLNLNLNVGGLNGLMIDGTTRNVSLGGTIANESLVTSGGLRLGNSTGTNAGTLRYNGSDLQGYVGGAWKSLTGNGLWQLNNSDAYLASGRVGIGTSTPAEKLEVNGAIKIGSTFTSTPGTIRFGGFGDIFEGYDGTSWKSLQSKWNVTASNNIYSSASQNVGIGVQDGQQKLEVDGAVKIGTTAVNTSGTVRFENGDFEGFDGSEWRTFTGKDYFLKNATSIFLYDANKNLGLGTAFPTEKLEVTGGIKLGLASATPTVGTMQYNGGLQVHNGTDWLSLTPHFNLDGSNNLSNITATNFGLGIATPLEKLEVNGGIKIGASFGANEGTIRYTSNEFEGYDGTNWKSLTGKGLWNKVGANLSLATTTDNVGIGTTTPASKLQVENSGTQLIVKETTDAAAKINFLNDGTSNFWGLTGYSNATNTTAGFNINYNGTSLFTVNGAGDATLAGTLTQTSDMRLKRNIAPLGSVLDRIKNVGAFTYNWKDEKKDQTQQIGFLAQDLEKQFPQLVKTDANGGKSVAYSNMVPVLLQAVKDQQAQIEILQQQLKSKNESLEKRLEMLEKMMQNQSAEKTITTK